MDQQASAAHQAHWQVFPTPEELKGYLNPVQGVTKQSRRIDVHQNPQLRRRGARLNGSSKINVITESFTWLCYLTARTSLLQQKKKPLCVEHGHVSSVSFSLRCDKLFARYPKCGDVMVP